TLPAIDGIVEGRGLISFADLRTADLRGLALTWTDAVGNVSRVTGDARVGYGMKVPTVNVSLVLDPISMAALARIDTTITIRSTLAGKLVASGSLDSLAWKASVAVDSGSRMAFEGTAAWKNPEWRVAGIGDIQSFDVRRWTGRTDVPTT